MTRQPLDTAHVNLRIRENLRAKLARAAEKNRVSLNTEIRTRLEDSFQRDARRTFDELAEELKTTWLRLGERLEQIAAVLAADDSEKTKEPQQAAVTNLMDVLRRKVRERPVEGTKDVVQITKSGREKKS
jgi:hypothetical protein